MTKEQINLDDAVVALNMGIAIVNTVWLALQRAETEEDQVRAIDTLFEGKKKLEEAERLLGLSYAPRGGVAK